MNNDIFTVIIMFLIVIIVYKRFNVETLTIQDPKTKISYEISEDYPDYKKAYENMKELNQYVIKVIKSIKTERDNGFDFDDKKYFIDNLLKRYNPDVLIENEPNNSDTSYVMNKGDSLHICLRDKEGKLHDSNILRFVVLHEITHIGSKEPQHGREFWTNFKWLLHFLENHQLYKPVDYSKKPTIYCGLKLANNPYFMDFN
jgi:hypothetical protein